MDEDYCYWCDRYLRKRYTYTWRGTKYGFFCSPRCVDEVPAGEGHEIVETCFITTAVCGARGLPDDCPELTSLRAFRDRWVAASEHGALQVAWYYAVAPRRVAQIERALDRDAVYLHLHERYIAPAAHAARVGDDPAAESIYAEMMGWIGRRFGDD